MTRRSWAAGLTAAAALAAVPATADAAGLATAPATARATTLSWSAVLADSTGAVQTGKPLTVSWGLLDTTPRYASVRNNGTAALTGETYTVTASLATVRLDACVGGTWSGSTCSGTVVTLTDSTSGSTAVTRALAAGDQLGLRLTPSGLLGLASATVSVSVSRAQVRAATTSSS
ncbi:hypothetical protein Amsp01_101260 [Amycolatopsis sp. NBRC 101858]|uniref:hypothetical protein n=1 Tax=Amycolatopsis sp. NBRC 101858 TaxID=3032200 RepID=UPI0024A29AAF|nr:hypothetical protein [Amycolatopsis sp. NBRC 101858]GLY44103.1 hypothetical protein Amsp01_101260 [Amycolatopsis sp. NBRC 101858]